MQGLRGAASAPCKACGKVNWRVDVLWPNTETMGWKAAHRGA